MSTKVQVVHPAWCHREFCDASAGPANVRHLSRPYTFTGSTGNYLFQLFKYQDGGGDPGYLWRIRDLSMHTDLDLPISLHDIHRASTGLDLLSRLS